MMGGRAELKQTGFMFAPFRIYFYATALSLWLTGAAAQAIDKTWGNTGTNWTTGANWVGGSSAGASDVAIFGSTSSAINPNLGSDRSVQGITINNSNADYSITQSGSPNTAKLTIGGSGLTITGGGVTSIAPIITVAVAQTWDTGSTNLTLAGGLEIAGDATSLTLNGTSTLIKVTGNVITTDSTYEIRLGGQGSMEVSGSLTAGVLLESLQQFTGSLTLSGNNASYNAATTFWRGGTLKLSSANALGTGAYLQLGSSNSIAGASVLTTGAYTVSREIIFTNNNAVDSGKGYTVGGSQTSGTSIYSGPINLGTSATTAPVGGLSLTSASGGVVDFSGLISGTQATADGSGRISKITKIGDGVVRFTRAAGNTYAGGTVINQGTLLVTNTSGSATGTGAVTVDATGTLGGSGFIGANGALVTTTVNGNLNPGDSTLADTRDTLTFRGTLTLNSTATTNLEIASLSDFDKVVVTGTGGGVLNLDGTIRLDFATFASSNFASNFTLDVLDWTTINAPGFNVATDLLFLNVNTGGNAGSWNVTNFTTDGTFSWVAVPEPSSLGLLCLGALGLLWRKRRAD